MKEKLFNNETKRKAGQQGREESQHPVYQRQPKQLGLYDAENEHDACGVGMLVNIHGGKSHELVESALKVLENMRHRGAEGADNKTGDGAGILLQIPHEFILLQGIPVPEKGKYGTGLLFLPKDEKDQGAILSIIILYRHFSATHRTAPDTDHTDIKSFPGSCTDNVIHVVPIAVYAFLIDVFEVISISHRILSVGIYGGDIIQGLNLNDVISPLFTLFQIILGFIAVQTLRQ